MGVTTGEVRLGRANWVNGVKYMVMEGNYYFER